MKRRLLSAFLAVMMVLTMAPVAFAADTANTEDVSWSGEGTEANPYQIKNVADLQALSDAVAAAKTQSGKHFKLEEDIDMSSVSNWTPIGNLVSYPGTTFSGTFDGNGKTISNLTVSDTTSNYATAGLFGSTNGTIKNLTLKNVNVTSTHYAGGIVAYSSDQNNNAIIDNCHVDGGTITSTSEVVGNAYDNGDKVGGIVGYCVTGDTIANCSVKNVTITAYRDLGGIVGCASGTVSNCTVGENVKLIVDAEHNYKNYTTLGQHNVNSIIGRNIEGATVSNCTGTVTIGYKDAAAKIDVVEYLTLAAAIENADNNVTVTLLKDVTEDVVIPAGKTVTLDLNGHKLTNVASHTIFNNGTLTINGEGTVDNVTNGKAAVYNAVTGNASINGGSYTRSAEASKDENNSGGNSWYVIHNYGIMNINKGTFKFSDTNVGAYSSLIHNGWYDGKENTAQKNAVMTINGGDFTQGTGGKITVKNDDYGELNITGGVFTQPQSDYYCIFSYNIAKISGGTINGYVGNAYADDTCDKGDMTISGDAVINGDIQDRTDANTGKQNLIKITDNAKVAGKITSADVKYVSISSGYFTSDPSAYCVTGKTGVSSGNSTYPWTVGEKSANAKPAEVATAKVAATVDKNASEAAKAAAEDIGGATMAQNEAIKAATKSEANKNTIEPATKVEGNKTVTDKLKDALPTGTTVSDSDVKIVYQTYIDVEVKAAAQENGTFTELTVELTPMYRVIAAPKTATNYNVDVDNKGTSKAVNAVQIVGEKPLTLTGKYEVTLHLPNGFVVPSDNKLSIKHQKSSGVEYYTGTVDRTTNMVTFETNGFSPFTISAVAAYVGTNAYPTLQEAANAAKDGDEITVVQNKNLDLTFNTTKSVKVKNDTGAAITVKFNGTDKGVAAGATETFSYTKPSGGSSGGSSSGKTTYKVTTSAVNNGGVNASPSSAEKGASITITLSPDKGYKLDKLTVTDGSGKTVSTVKKSDTVYTFTMPASAVNVGVSYVKADETPSETKFNDVSANDWFASAVDYVTGKGMMNGIADNTFSPKANTTRGMVVTVLYRLENQPSTSAASFTDVASGAYYANAVAWANANGIVSGYGSGKFGPNDKVTREQLAAILYRYAQYKKYDVSGANSLDGYADAQSVSSYAVPALQWANAAGVVTGKSGSKLDPKGNAARAEVAAMLMRFCENVK